MAPMQISSLLEKMTSPDKYFRLMAAKNLLMELEKEALRLDEDTERRISEALLCLIDDEIGEIQNVAVKCLESLVVNAKPLQVKLIMDSLIANLESGKQSLCDASSIALQNIINKSPPPHSPAQIFAIDIVNKSMHKIATHLRSNEVDSSAKIASLNVLFVQLTKLAELKRSSNEQSERESQVELERQRQELSKKTKSYCKFFVFICACACVACAVFVAAVLLINSSASYLLMGHLPFLNKMKEKTGIPDFNVRHYGMAANRGIERPTNKMPLNKSELIRTVYQQPTSS